MTENNPFFAVPNLGDNKTFVSQKASSAKNTDINNVAENNAAFSESNMKDFFVSASINKDADSGFENTGLEKSIDDVPREFTAELRKELSSKLMDNSSAIPVKKVVIDSSKERVIVRFLAPGKNISCDIEVPLDITANDLIVGLNDAYKLDIDLSDIRQCYMSCENPVALLKGKRLLGEYGVRDGSLITYYR